MKNIHLLPTKNKTRIHYYEFEGELFLSATPANWRNGKHIYITSDEKLPYDDSVFNTGAFYHKDVLKNVHIITKDTHHPNPNFCNRIILTTDESLFEYGVQVIDDEFLEWFVKNPSCENIPIITIKHSGTSIYITNIGFEKWRNETIPQEETKQETLEKEFVPYEQSLKLKQLGFDEPCFFAFDNCSSPMRCSDLRTNKQKFEGVNYNSSTYTSQPTFSQAFRWFRVKYQIFPEILTDCTTYPKFVFTYTQFFGNPKNLSEQEWGWKNNIAQYPYLYRTYEEAELACLEKLIEIITKQQQ